MTAENADDSGGRLPRADPATLNREQEDIGNAVPSGRSRLRRRTIHRRRPSPRSLPRVYARLDHVRDPRPRTHRTTMKLSALPDRRAEHDPHGPAVADPRQTLSNKSLLHRVQAAAEHLCALGIGVGDVVAVKLRNRIEFVVLLFAAWRLG